MIDPLADVVALLQPSARFSKSVVGAGTWRVRRSDAGQPFYCVVLEGGCHIAVDGQAPIELQPGDFLLVPAAWGVAMSSLDPPSTETDTVPLALGDGSFRIGAPDGPIDLRLVIGHCHFDSPDAALLVSLLPRLVLVRSEQRLALLVTLLREETRARRPARDAVMTRLLEVLLIEALRANTGTEASPGLARGLADPRLALALRAMHERPDHAWTVAALAGEAALSRSAFFERFNRTVGIAPMAYLLAWRMALAKQLLRRREASVTEVAERVGYSSASTFSIAFARHVGQPPMRYAREQAAARTEDAADETVD